MESNKVKIINRNINVGIQILRFLLCFWIVISHSAKIKDQHKKLLARGFHVPTFILISFYFFYPLLEKRVIVRIISRFQRLLIPYIIWPLIFFVTKNFIIKFISPDKFGKYLNFKDIYIQILTGTRFHIIFWFQFNLLFLSLLLSIVSFIFKNHFLVILKFMGIISFYLNISGRNLKLFSSYHRHYRISLGSLIEVMPLVVVGSIYSSMNLLVKVNKFSLHFKLILFLLIIILFKYDLFIIYRGCMYSDILLYLHATTILFLFFGSLDFNKLKMINSALILITKFTGGIYCIHPAVGEYLRVYILFFKKASYFSEIINYIINYMICFVGNKIFYNNKLKYLFT